MVYDSVIVDSHVVLPSGVVDRNIVIDGGQDSQNYWGYASLRPPD